MIRLERHGLAIAGTIALATLTHPSSAAACGGFFCNASAPVEQAGENLIFGIESDGTLSVHIQILYTGPSDRFAWILPLPSIPTSLDVGTDRLFTALESRTRATFETNERTEGTCRERPRCEYPAPPDGGPWWGAQDAAAADAGASPGPDVHFRGEVGPYDAVVLSAGTTDELTTWLRDNGFDIPTAADPLIADYVAARHVFVALRLLSDRMTGEILPLVLRYAEGQPCVPIRLTSIAATPDMPITAYFLARAYVATDSYSALEPTYDDARLFEEPWDRQHYVDYVSNAIDDAGRRAFVTEYAGATPVGIDVSIPSPTASGRPETPRALFDSLAEIGLAGDPQLFSMLQRFLPPPVGWDPQTYYNCLARSWDDGASCGYVPGSWDLDGLLAAIEDQIVRPRREATEMVRRHARLTRLFTTMSPEEMTIDPTFRLDEGLPSSSNVHTATLVQECSEEYVEGDAPRRLERPSGAVLRRHGGRRYLGDAAWCEVRGGWPAGMPPVRYPDGGIARLPDGALASSSGGSGCSATHARGSGVLALLVIGAVAALRRRRDR